MEVFPFVITKVLPFILPFILAKIAWKSWMKYLNTEHLAGIKWITLQIILPKEVYKSPAAMEIVLTNAFYQTGGTGTWIKKYWQGKLRTYFSLELVSIDGKVYFFMRVPRDYKNIVEAQIYGQYPQVEVIEVDDYVNQIPHDPQGGGWSMWGCEFKLTKPDAYPIKTYVDYGLDKQPPISLNSSQAPSAQADPLSSMIEYMGSMRKGEQLWLQIMIRATDAERSKKPGTWFGKQGWLEDSAELVKKLKEKHKGEKDKPATPMSEVEKETIAAIERGLGKYGFDVGIRGIYLAQKEIFNPVNIPALIGIFKQFSSNNLNGFKPTRVVDFDYPWQDPWKKRETHLKKEMLEAYRLRSYFYPPHHHYHRSMLNPFEHRSAFVLNSEELATIYHFPGRGTETPTFKRVDSKKGEPPANLPI